MKRALTIGISGGIAAIILAAIITGPIVRHTGNGGSWWWLWLLFTPLLVAAVCLVVGAKVEHHQRNRRPVRPPVPQWRILDEEYEPGPVPKVDPFAEVAAALAAPFGMATYPPRPRKALTPEQLALAAEDARAKRLMDGQGDQ